VFHIQDSLTSARPPPSSDVNKWYGMTVYQYKRCPALLSDEDTEDEAGSPAIVSGLAVLSRDPDLNHMRKILIDFIDSQSLFCLEDVDLDLGSCLCCLEFHISLSFTYFL
jgi:hypothetical protein